MICLFCFCVVILKFLLIMLLQLSQFFPLCLPPSCTPHPLISDGSEWWLFHSVAVTLMCCVRRWAVFTCAATWTRVLCVQFEHFEKFVFWTDGYLYNCSQNIIIATPSFQKSLKSNNFKRCISVLTLPFQFFPVLFNYKFKSACVGAGGGMFLNYIFWMFVLFYYFGFHLWVL